MTINRKSMPRIIGGYRSKSRYELDADRTYRQRRWRDTAIGVVIWILLALVWRMIDAGI
jgi:hypothetical protein